MNILNSNSLNSQEERQLAMFLHFSQFAGCIIPVLGWLIPLILWQMNKDKSAYIDRHGKIVMNWILTSLILSIIGGILVFLFVGVFVLGALAICSIIFAIIGGIRANEGQVWEYPFLIKLIK